MTDKARIFCLSEIDKYKSRDAFVSELALAPIWRGDRSLQSERIETLGKLWDAYYRIVPEILTASGMSMIELSKFFHIPYTTVQNWCSKQAKRYCECPVYVRLMMQEMFTACYQLNNVDRLRNWDVSNVKDMSGMFEDCTALSHVDGLAKFGKLETLKGK